MTREAAGVTILHRKELELLRQKRREVQGRQVRGSDLFCFSGSVIQTLYLYLLTCLDGSVFVFVFVFAFVNMFGWVCISTNIKTRSPSTGTTEKA